MSMLKYVKYMVASIVLCSQAISMQLGETTQEAAALPKPITIMHEVKLKGKCGDISYRSLKGKDVYVAEALVSRCKFQEGLPANTENVPEGVFNWADNLSVRQQVVGNPYSGLLLSVAKKPDNPEEKYIGFLNIGIMPAIGVGNGYDLKEHEVIIRTFEQLGAIRLKDKPQEPLAAAELKEVGLGAETVKKEVAEPKFTKDIFELVPNCGLGHLLPVLPNLSEAQVIDALRIGVNAFQYLKDNGFKLPREGTIPAYVVGLFDPTDPLIPHLKSVGFDIMEDEGFFKFYSKPRHLAVLKLK